MRNAIFHRVQLYNVGFSLPPPSPMSTPPCPKTCMFCTYKEAALSVLTPTRIAPHLAVFCVYDSPTPYPYASCYTAHPTDIVLEANALPGFGSHGAVG